MAQEPPADRLLCAALWVSAVPTGGFGGPSHSLACPHLLAERPAPPRQLQVPQAEVTARSLQLQWVPGSDGASPIRYFTAQVRELPKGPWQTYSSSISHEATACAVERYEGPEAPPQTCSPPLSPRSSSPREGRAMPLLVHTWYQGFLCPGTQSMGS